MAGSYPSPTPRWLVGFEGGPLRSFGAVQQPALVPAVKAVVTGAAGFIGSHLTEGLLEKGHEVRGVDCFTGYYDPSMKRANLRGVAEQPGFEFLDIDLRVRDPRPLLADADVVFHLAAQPGVRLSWSEGFALYDEHNILVTQRLLEAAKDVGLGRFIFASSSSVYGNAPSYPTHEADLPRPHSPYGVTKLAAEHLCNLYAHNWGVPAVSLRYFTVYGPRQRPDMAIHRLVEAAIAGVPFTLYGTGRQVRDFTHVSDVVAANLAAAEADVAPGTVVNVAGGSSSTMNELVMLVGEVLGTSVHVVHQTAQPGDVERTGGSIQLAHDLLGWSPRVSLRAGVDGQARWHLERRGVTSSGGLREASTGPR